jgi:TP901 family phage tail tape measure protein
MTDSTINLKIRLDEAEAASNLKEFESAFKKALQDLGKTGVEIKAFSQMARDIRAGKTEVQSLEGEIKELYQLYAQGRQLAADRDFLGISAHSKVRDEIAKVQSAYERLKASGKLTGEELAQASLKAHERVRELEKSTNGWAESLENAKGAITGVVAAGAGVATIVTQAVQFESAMADVAKVVDGTEGQIGALADRIKELSTELPISADELAKMAAAGGQLGIPIQNLEQFIVLSAKMATAFGISSEQAGAAVAKLTNVFGISLNEVEKLGDAINVLGNTTAAREGDIVEVLTRIGGTAKQFGLATEQAAALSAAMLSLGKTPEVAATGINALLSKLQAAPVQGEKFQEALDRMGLSARQLADSIRENPQKALDEFLTQLEGLDNQDRAEILAKLFGIEYQDDISALVNSLKLYRESLGRVGEEGKTAGALTQEFGKRMGTTEAQLQILKNTTELIAINLGSVFLPAIKAIASGLGDGATAIAEFAEKFPVLSGLAVTIATGAAAVAGLTLAFKSLGIVGAQTATRLRAEYALLSTQLNVATLSANKLALAVRGIVAAVVAFDLGKGIGNYLVENFAAARQAGVLMAQGLQKAFNAIQLAWEATTAAFTDDTAEEAFKRYEQRAAEATRIFGEMFDEAATSAEIWTGNADAAASATESLIEPAGQAAAQHEKLAVKLDDVALAAHKGEVGLVNAINGLVKLAEAGELTEEKLKELPKALEELTGDGLRNFAAAASEALVQAGANAGDLGNVIEATAVEAVRRLNEEAIKTGEVFDDGSKAAIQSLQSLGVEAGVVSDAIQDRLSKALAGAKTGEEVRAIGEQFRQIAVQAGLSTEQISQGFQLVDKELVKVTSSTLTNTTEQLKHNAAIRDGAAAAGELANAQASVGDKTSAAAAQTARAIEQANNQITSSGQSWFLGIINDYTAALEQFSKKAGEEFRRSFGQEIPDQIDLSKLSIEEVNRLLAETAGKISAARNEQGRYNDDLSEWAIKQKLAFLEIQQETLGQVAKMKRLAEAAQEGALSVEDLEYWSRNAARSFDLLDDRQMDSLISAIDEARQKFKDLSDDIREETRSLQDELDELQGNRDEIERREFEQRRKELEEKLAAARQSGDRDLIREAEKALALLKQIEQERTRQREEEEKADAAREAERAQRDTERAQRENEPEPDRPERERDPEPYRLPEPPSSRRMTLRFEAPSGRSADVEITEAMVQELLRVLREAGAVVITGES